MSVIKETNLVKEILDAIPEKHQDPRLQALYAQGYIVGILSQLAHDDSFVRKCLYEHLKKITG